MKTDLLSWLSGFIVVVIFWQIGSIFLEPTYLPPPFLIIQSIITNSEIHAQNMGQTILEASVGLIFSIILSAMIVIAIGVFPKSELAIYPFIILIKATPAVAFVPIFVLLVGTGIITKITVSSMICFFPLVIGGIDGLKRTPQRFQILCDSYGSNNFTSLINVKSGFVISGFLSGLKTAAPLSVIGAIVGEYITGNNQAGLGAFIITNYHKSIKINLYAGAILSTILGLLFFGTSSIIYNFYEKRTHIGK